MQDGQLKWLYEGPSIDFLSIHPFSLSISGPSQDDNLQVSVFRSKTGSQGSPVWGLSQGVQYTMQVPVSDQSQGDPVSPV